MVDSMWNNALLQLGFSRYIPYICVCTCNNIPSVLEIVRYINYCEWM